MPRQAAGFSCLFGTICVAARRGAARTGPRDVWTVAIIASLFRTV
jgi:hypothetical protein